MISTDGRKVSSFALDSSTLSHKLQPKIPQAECGNRPTEGKEGRPLPQSGAEGASGLSAFHISPLVWKETSLPAWDSVTGYGDFISHWRDCRVPVYQQSPSVIVEPKAIVTETGTLAKVVTERLKVDSNSRQKPAKRGSIATFTKGSKRRLLRLLAKTEKKARPHFVTLTYPDCFPTDPKEVKRHLDNLGKRFRRKWASGAFVWRMEYKARLSGENVGQIAPHLHLLAWGVDYRELRDWLPESWYEIVDSGDEKHLAAGTSVEFLHSWRGVMHYASKYLAKEIEAGLSTTYAGRWWGVIGRGELPLSAVVVVKLTALQAIKATRVGRKMLKMKSKSLRYGLTWLVDGKNFADYIDFLTDSELSGAMAGESNTKNNTRQANIVALNQASRAEKSRLFASA